MNIALVAHDSRKRELIEWVKYNMNELKSHNLFATGTTGKLIRGISDYVPAPVVDGGYDENKGTFRYVEGIQEYPLRNKVTCLLSGPLGGDQQIGSMIAEGKIDVLIFFCDNLIVQGHQNDVSALTRLASLYNIAFATNRTTADMILTSSLFNNSTYKRIVPEAIEKYKNRPV